MKTMLLVLAGVVALASAPAEARVVVHPHVHVGLGFGAPYYYPFGWYDPWFYPSPFWYEPLPRRSNDQDQNAVENLFVYPANGQSEEQTAQDRTECKSWASTQTNFDPSTAKKRDKEKHMADYNRAFTACMEGRNYTVE